jgi:hypothetical protein
VKRMSFPILQRIIALLGVQPSTVRIRPTATPRLVQQTIGGKTFHVDPYSFGSEELHLWQDIQQRPFVPSEEKYSFGPESYSASATLRHRRKGPIQKVGPVESLSKETYDFGSGSRRPNLSETEPMIYSEYEPSRIDFGEGCSRRRYFYLEPHIAQQQPIAFAKRSSATEENVVRESFQEFMHGTMPKPITQPTIKSSVDMRKEKYSFLEG